MKNNESDTKLSSYSIFLPLFYKATVGDGGGKRSNQLGCAFLDEHIDALPQRRNYTEFVKYIFIHPLLSLIVTRFALSCILKGLTLKGAIVLIAHGTRVLSLLRSKGVKRVYLETSSSVTHQLAVLLAKLKYEVITIPQNVEFLVPGKRLKYTRNERSAFDFEKRAYSASSAVWTISEFDAAVVRALGCDSVSVYDYYPSKEDEVELLEIKRMRQNSDKSFYLILGSANNPPTKLGIERLLANDKILSSGFRFILAGNGTEYFKCRETEQLEVLGRVSNETLKHLLSSSLGLLIFQPQTSGFLTRLIDANIAGVPCYVISEYVQADGLEQYGIKRVNSMNDIKSQFGEFFQQFARPLLPIEHDCQ